MPRLPILERAFELAASGSCQTFDDLRKQLKAEGYETASQMAFPSLRRQLSGIIQSNRVEPATVETPTA